MILLFSAILLLVRAIYSLAEICFEHDWPRQTWRGLALAVVLFTFCVSIFV